MPHWEGAFSSSCMKSRTSFESRSLKYTAPHALIRAAFSNLSARHEPCPGPSAAGVTFLSLAYTSSGAGRTRPRHLISPSPTLAP